MCVRCGTGRVAWCTSPDNHASEEQRMTQQEKELDIIAADATLAVTQLSNALEAARQISERAEAVKMRGLRVEDAERMTRMMIHLAAGIAGANTVLHTMHDDLETLVKASEPASGRE